jgi:tetratricopeptide (TPR) repeat protein
MVSRYLLWGALLLGVGAAHAQDNTAATSASSSGDFGDEGKASVAAVSGAAIVAGAVKLPPTKQDRDRTLKDDSRGMHMVDDPIYVDRETNSEKDKTSSRIGLAASEHAPADRNGGSASATNPPTSPVEANTEIEELMRSGDRTGAIALAREARQQWPDDKNLLAYQKLIDYRRPHFYDRALELAGSLLKSVASSGETAGGADAVRADSRSLNQSPALAGAISFQGMGTGGAPTAAITRSAMSAMALRDYQKLDEKMSSLLAVNPNDYRSYRGRSYARWKMGRYSEAIDDARSAVRLAPKDMLSRSALVDSLVDAGRPKEAVVEAQRALVEEQGLPPDPALAHLFHARSRAWAEMKEEDREFDDLARAAELQPNAYGAMYQEAVRHKFWRKLVRLELPDNPFAQLAIGGAGAAALLFPAYFAFCWLRRRSASKSALRPAKLIFP